MDPAKYRALFITESREHVEGLSRCLLALEKTPADRGALDELFRHAHSVKGMAAAMGYDPLAQLSHRLEDLADLARRGAAFDQEVVDLWLQGLDALTAMVAQVQSGHEADLALPPVVAQVETKAARMASQLQPKPGAPAAAPPLPASVVPVAAPPSPAPGPVALPGTLRVRVTIREQAASPHVRAFLVHKRVGEKVEVLESSPTVPELRQGHLPDRVLTLHVRGGLSAPELEALVQAIPDVAACAVETVAAPTVPAPAVGGVPAVTPGEATATLTVRVRTALLDDLIDSVGEMMLARERLRRVAQRLEDPDLAELCDEFARLSQTLNDRVMSTRMNPVSILTDRLPRVVRDLAKKRGREVVFSVEGAGIELDRAVLDVLHDPLLHVVRNAVDHAHEGPAQRLAAGKPEAMSLKVTASRDRDHVLLEVQDDGRGMDPVAIKESAVRKGVIRAEEAAGMTEAEALELVCRPGFSTAEQVSDTSGRGVGMDVVRSTVEHMGGTLLIQSQVGVGTRFTLRLPLTVAIIRVLLVHAGPPDAVFALPLNRVQHALDYDPAALVRSQGVAMLPLGDGLATLHDLACLVGYDPLPESAGGVVVVVDQPFRPVAVRVQRIIEQQEVVVKPLGEPLASVPFLSGAALLADGRPAYVLDLPRLCHGGGDHA
jgi:two-component system chemotaxis sensor kinase CheA